MRAPSANDFTLPPNSSGIDIPFHFLTDSPKTPITGAMVVSISASYLVVGNALMPAPKLVSPASKPSGTVISFHTLIDSPNVPIAGATIAND